jgi:hypothetical protein
LTCIGFWLDGGSKTLQIVVPHSHWRRTAVDADAVSWSRSPLLCCVRVVVETLFLGWISPCSFSNVFLPQPNNVQVHTTRTGVEGISSRRGGMTSKRVTYDNWTATWTSNWQVIGHDRSRRDWTASCPLCGYIVQLHRFLSSHPLGSPYVLFDNHVSLVLKIEPRRLDEDCISPPLERCDSFHPGTFVFLIF